MWKGFTERAVRTSPDSNDPVLSGRTYAIPFDPVWTAALGLASGRLRGWTVVGSDDQLGVIRADVRSPLLPLKANVLIAVTLDPNGQTRLDISARGDHRGGDLRVNYHRIKRFFASLDRVLGARPEQILEPWSPTRHAA